MSNLKQIWLGAMQYVQDYDDMLPAITYGDTNKNSTHYYRWMDVIEPYVRSPQIFSCPSDRINPRYVYATNITSTTASAHGSYGLNNTYNNNKSQPASQWNVSASGGTYDKKYASVAAPSTTIYCLEKTDSKVWYVQWKDQANQPSLSDVTDDPEDFIPTEAFSDNYINEGISLRHFQTTNALFCDGHVKSVRSNFLFEKSSGGALRYFTTADD
jgi:prepilin-type processing-associated H-X9-DG protein